jgi:hypothetical protein
MRWQQKERNVKKELNYHIFFYSMFLPILQLEDGIESAMHKNKDIVRKYVSSKVQNGK